jgi:hypothetical protein
MLDAMFPKSRLPSTESSTVDVFTPQKDDVSSTPEKDDTPIIPERHSKTTWLKDEGLWAVIAEAKKLGRDPTDDELKDLFLAEKNRRARSSRTGICGATFNSLKKRMKLIEHGEILIETKKSDSDIKLARLAAALSFVGDYPITPVGLVEEPSPIRGNLVKYMLFHHKDGKLENAPYKVKIWSKSECSCLDYVFNKSKAGFKCKHILRVLLHEFKLPIDSPYLSRTWLQEEQEEFLKYFLESIMKKESSKESGKKRHLQNATPASLSDETLAKPTMNFWHCTACLSDKNFFEVEDWDFTKRTSRIKAGDTVWYIPHGNKRAKHLCNVISITNTANEKAIMKVELQGVLLDRITVVHKDSMLALAENDRTEEFPIPLSKWKPVKRHEGEKEKCEEMEFLPGPFNYGKVYSPEEIAYYGFDFPGVAIDLSEESKDEAVTTIEETEVIVRKSQRSARLPGHLNEFAL